MTDLETLVAVRDLLEKSYVPWVRSDGKGGHCQLGCWDAIGGFVAPLYRAVGDLGWDMFPELRGMEFRRRWPETGNLCKSVFFDSFDDIPLVTINNHLGKDAILSVYNRAIELETERESRTKSETNTKSKPQSNPEPLSGAD